MVRKDKKVFVIGLVASSFALMTTLKAQNYSYESYARPYVKSEAAVTQGVSGRTSTHETEDVDFSSRYSDGISVSYANDRYPAGEIASKRKVMRMGTHSHAFNGGRDGGDWVVRIGEEEIMPMGFVDGAEVPVDNLRQSQRMQYGNLLEDELNLGGEAVYLRDAVTTSDTSYTYPDYNVVDEAEVYGRYSDKAQEKYQDISEMSQRIKEQKSYPWEQSSTKRGVVYNNTSSREKYASGYVEHRIENPWAKEGESEFRASNELAMRPVISAEISYADENVKNIKIERKNQLQQRQQAYALPNISQQKTKYNSFQKVSTSVVAPEYYQEEYSFEQYSDGTASSRADELGAPKDIKADVSAKQPLLVPINDVVESEPNREVERSAVVTEYVAEVIPVQPVMSADVTAKKDTGISLTELKINFKPFKADLSVKTMKWLKEFSKKAAVNFDNIVEIRVSPNVPYLQNERLLMLKGVLNSNGVYDQQIRVIANRRNADSVVVKVIENEEEEQIDVVDYQALDGSYYYYY